MSKDEFLSVGGQAIVEGVMMRSPKYFAVACRAPNKELIVQAEPIEKTWIGKQKWLKVPFLRGSWALLDSMSLGIRAMRFASDIQLAPKYQPEGETPQGSDTEIAVAKARLEKLESEADVDVEVVGTEFKPPENAPKKIQEGVVLVTMIISLVFGLLVFKLLPQALGTFLREKQHFGDIKTNAIIEAIHATFFIGYMIAIGQLPTVKEVFRYHGAEHKAINTWEAELPLTMENCRAQTRLHPRCGTSFAIIVIILEFFVFTFIPRVNKGNFFIEAISNFALHIAILPIIAGVAYELLRFAGKFRDNSAIMLLFKPGLWTQLITTQEPRDDQIEVALASLKACLDGEASMTTHAKS